MSSLAPHIAPQLGPPDPYEVERQIHLRARGLNQPKSEGGVLPYTISEFELLAKTTGIADLRVERVTHWRHSDASFYNEFITVHTAPSPLSLPPSPDAAREFDWTSLAGHGLAFRIDRGEQPTPERDASNLREHLIPIDLVEVLRPGDPILSGSESPPYEPILTFHRRSTSHSEEDPCALRVKDFLFFLNRHAERAVVYTSNEWEPWEFAASLVRFILRYRLAWGFDTLVEPGRSALGTGAREGEDDGGEVTRAHGGGGSEEFVQVYNEESGAWLDEHIFGPEEWIGTRTNYDSEIEQEVPPLFDLPHRGHLGVLRSMRPLRNAMNDPTALVLVTHSCGQLLRWPGVLSEFGILGEVVEIVGAICSPERDAMDATRTLHQYVVLNLVEFLRVDHTTCMPHIQAGDTLARVVWALENTDDFELVEVASLLLEVMSGFEAGVDAVLRNEQAIPVMLRRASSDPTADPATVDRFCYALCSHSVRARTAVIEVDFPAWAVEHLKEHTRFPDLILSTLWIMLEDGPATLSQERRRDLVAADLPKTLLAIIEDHPNLRYDREDPPVQQGFILRSRALRVLCDLSQFAVPSSLGLDESGIGILVAVLKDPRLNPWEAYDTITLLLLNVHAPTRELRDAALADAILPANLDLLTNGAASGTPQEQQTPEVWRNAYTRLLAQLSILGPRCHALVHAAYQRHTARIPFSPRVNASLTLT